MSANPYKREWWDTEDDDGKPMRATVEAQARVTRHIWREAERDSEARDDTGRAALRIRWAARVACARLRVERDHFRLPAQELYGLVNEAEARANEMAVDLHTAERDRVSLRLALHHLCNAVYRYRVPDNITDADLIALAEKLSKELNRDESGNDC